MTRRLFAAPVRLLLGLPALYGMSLHNRWLQILRCFGLYSGPIHWTIRAKTIQIASQG